MDLTIGGDESIIHKRAQAGFGLRGDDSPITHAPQLPTRSNMPGTEDYTEDSTPAADEYVTPPHSSKVTQGGRGNISERAVNV